MPLDMESPANLPIEVQPLRQHLFAEFGTVVANPLSMPDSPTSAHNLRTNAVRANQGTALKYSNVTDVLGLYDSAPSGVASKVVVSMFVCSPRTLHQSRRPGVQGTFEVEVLERHPFTTQTFIPLGLSSAEQDRARYLVIVAPSLLPSPDHEPLPASYPSAPGRPRSGRPDLTRIQAFIADGSQAVTYGLGTWHAPMVVIGVKPVDFVVVQHANGVDIEDCQEVFTRSHGQQGLHVAVPRVATKEIFRGSKL